MVSIRHQVLHLDIIVITEIRGQSLGHDGDFGVFGEFVKLSESLESSLEFTMVDLETVWKYFLDVFFQF